LNSFDKTDREYSLAHTDDPVRFWGSEVKGKGHSRPTRWNLVKTMSRELLEQSR